MLLLHVINFVIICLAFSSCVRWMSGITHVYNPQVWVCSLRFMFGASLQDRWGRLQKPLRLKDVKVCVPTNRLLCSRVLSESGCFLLVVFGSTHRAPQFFQCRGSRTGPQLECQILTSTQSVTLYQVTTHGGSDEVTAVFCLILLQKCEKRVNFEQFCLPPPFFGRQRESVEK